MAISYHEAAGPSAFCTADFPVVETTVPLGSCIEPGTECKVVGNSDTALKFVALQMEAAINRRVVLRAFWTCDRQHVWATAYRSAGN